MDSNFTLNKLLKAIKQVEESMPVWENEGLDKLMEQGKKISRIMLVSSEIKLKGVEYVPTKYGNLKVSFDPYIPPNSLYLVDASIIDDMYKPIWRE